MKNEGHETDWKAETLDSEVWLQQVAESVIGEGESLSAVVVTDVHETAVLGFSPEELAWRRKSLCLGSNPNLFFPPRGGSMLPAFAVCRGCAVRIECLGAAIENGDNLGVRGGHSQSERKRIRIRVRKGESYESASQEFFEKREVKLMKARNRQRILDQQRGQTEVA